MSEEPAQVPPSPAKPAGEVERGGWRALWLGGGGVLLAIFFAPLGLIAGIAALVTGVKARGRARRSHGAAPGAVGGIVLGTIGLLFSSVALAMTAFLWQELSGYQTCLNGANTNADRQSCQEAWFPRIEQKLGLPRGSMAQYSGLF
ncbi:MAG: DUF4190 domain-containing protein [Actinomadura sp.]